MTEENPEDQASPTTDAGKGGDPSPPEQLLQAVQDEIDDVRRRAAEDGLGEKGEKREEGEEGGEGEKKFVEEGAEDEDQPVDDTIAPPG